MPRTARIVLPGFPHHITQRGNNQQDVFFVDADRAEYLRLLNKHSLQYSFEVLGYCLMSNHVHIIGTPQTEQSLAQAIGRTNLIYTQYLNRLHNRTGHLWQNRFFSCALDERYFWTALRYVECNPVRAKLSRFPWSYPWSSASVHVGKPDRMHLINTKHWQTLAKGLNWRDILRQRTDDQDFKTFVDRHLHGRPLGSDSFLSKLEAKIGHRLRPRSVGRPSSKNQTTERS